MREVELLARAGDLENLKIAFIYGADAVYIGGEVFGMRSEAKNFSKEDMIEGVEFAHSMGKRVFVTVNIIPRSEDIDALTDYIKELSEIGVDAVIVSGAGVFNIVKKVDPNMEIHISTQASTSNYIAANFWYNQGAKRIVTAREMSFEETKQLRENTPDDMDIEAFIHGAMCMSYSGKCVISNYTTGRDANKGSCAQSCRWKYNLVEEKDGDWLKIAFNSTYGYINDDYVKTGFYLVEAIPWSSISDCSPTRQQILTFGEQYIGTPYVYGGTSLTGGIDCSSFVQQCYASAGFSLPRTSREQATRGTQITLNEAKPGDLLFYADATGTIDHVVMYLGDGKILHAALSLGQVTISKYNYSTEPVRVVNIIGD